MLSGLASLVFKSYIKDIVIVTKRFFLDAVCLFLKLALLVSKLFLLSVGCYLQSNARNLSGQRLTMSQQKSDHHYWLNRLIKVY